MFNNNYKNKKILITGHTGFKGAWLTIWLLALGAKIYGISNKRKVSNPSLFISSGVEKKIKNYYFDISNFKRIKKVINDIKPDFIFHLAAQSLVSESYKFPVRTLKSNFWGTLNLLEVLRNYDHHIVVILVTSDKCYKNFETDKGYKEDDKLGGDDIYSGSKASAEVIINSYFRSFIHKKQNISLASVRAGNVIGGGDWSKNRLIPDIMKNYFNNKIIKIRNPIATRPWQHVLEPLSGYLHLACCLIDNREKLNGEAFNFGPGNKSITSVKEIILIISKFTSNFNYKLDVKNKFHENTLLQLDCTKSKKLLSWKSILNIKQNLLMTLKWYEEYYHKKKISTFNFTLKQINNYSNLAMKKKIKWANGKKN